MGAATDAAPRLRHLVPAGATSAKAETDTVTGDSMTGVTLLKRMPPGGGYKVEIVVEPYELHRPRLTRSCGGKKVEVTCKDADVDSARWELPACPDEGDQLMLEWIVLGQKPNTRCQATIYAYDAENRLLEGQPGYPNPLTVKVATAAAASATPAVATIAIQ